jgi:hypothetical protein
MDCSKSASFEDFVVDEIGFVNKGVKYDFNKIIGLFFLNSVKTTNLFLHNKKANLSIKLVNDEMIKLWSFRPEISLWGSNKTKVDLLVDVYNLLRKYSFDSRVNYYTNQMKTRGYIEYTGYTGIRLIPQNLKIYNNGIIDIGDNKIDLNDVRRFGKIHFGISAQSLSGRSSLHHPNEIQISLKKDPSLYSLSSLNIAANWDSDIIHQVIKLLHDGKTIC